MKTTKIYWKMILLAPCMLILGGCDLQGPGENEINGAHHPLDSLPDGFVSKEDLGQAVSVMNARMENTPGKKLVVEGFIGGRAKPFAKGFALFILGDESLETCDELPDDHCPTPWDACCEDKDKILAGTLSVQILDENASLKRMIGSLEGIQGLQAGSKIKILCEVDKESIPDSMLVNARQIQIF